MYIIKGKNGSQYRITGISLNEHDYTVNVRVEGVINPVGYEFSLYDGRGVESQGIGSWRLDDDTWREYRDRADKAGFPRKRPYRPKPRKRRGRRTDPRQISMLGDD
jgi:hypothetical protein